MADWPTSIWTPPSRGTNMSDAVTQTDILDEQNDEIVAVQTALGQGVNDGAGTLRARLRAMGTTSAWSYGPGGNLDAGGGSWTTWITVGNITVPTWCTSVIVTASFSNWIVTATTNPLTFQFRTAVGGTAPSNGAPVFQHEKASTTAKYECMSWVDLIPAPSTGTQSLIVQAFRAAGASGTVRATTGTLFTGTYTFKG